MSRADAQSIVGGVWRGEFRADARFPQALATLGMSVKVFWGLSTEARKREKSLSRLFVLTPTGGRQRR